MMGGSLPNLIPKEEFTVVATNLSQAPIYDIYPISNVAYICGSISAPVRTRREQIRRELR